MQYISGAMLKELREQKKLTQRELAEQLNVSDKTISKWETGRGLPDVGILPELAASLSVSIPELLAGEAVTNRNRSGNMKRAKFYVCPVCGNVIASLGEGVFSCCGIQLPALEPEETTDDHEIQISVVDNEYLVELAHPMTKGHYLSFAALCTDEKMQLVKLYPEQDPMVRFNRRGHGVLYVYCNRHGLFRKRI